MRWKGPLRVLAVLSDHLYELEDIQTGEKMTVHGSRIKFFRNSEMDTDAAVHNYLAFQAGEYCIVEEILDIRKHHGQIQVLVRWKGFDDEDPTWTPIRELEQDVQWAAKKLEPH